MTFFSGFTFTVLVAFTHFPLFCLYVVWFKNGLMRFEAAREALVTRGVIKRRSSQQRGKSRIRGNATELERKNNDDIIAEQTEEEEKEEDEDEEDDENAYLYPERPMLPHVFPSVCLQLVIDGANDSNDQVTESIDSLCFVHWPRDLLEVHVLDLSSVRTMDESSNNTTTSTAGMSTFENAAVKCAARWRERGVMCDVFNVSEFETSSASGGSLFRTPSGNLKANEMTRNNSNSSNSINNNSNNKRNDIEQGESGTASSSGREERSHKIVSFGNALEKGRLKTRAEIIVPFTKDYLPDPEYLEHIIPSFYVRNTSSSAASNSMKKKYGGSVGGYLQTRDLRIACVVPNARFENSNLQTNTWFGVRARCSKQTSMTTICAEKSGCALSNAIPGTAFASSALKTIGGWDTRVNGAVPVADAGMRVWLHGLKVALPLSSKSSPSASRREVLSVRVPGNFANYCAKTYYEHRNYASLTHKHAVNCLLEANWVVTNDAQRSVASRSGVNMSSGAMMPGIDENETNDVATSARKKAAKKYAAFHGLTHQVLSTLLSFWCLLVLPTAFLKEIWLGNAAYVGGNVNANVLIWLVYILPCLSERLFDLAFALKATPPLPGEKNRFLTNFAFAFLANLATLPAKFAGCFVGLTLPLRKTFRGDKDESTTPFAVAVFETAVSCTAWWNCVKIIAWTVEETFSEFYFTSVVMLLCIGFAGLISSTATVNILKQFSIIKHDIKRDGVTAVTKKKMNLKNLKKHLRMRPPKASGEEKQGLLASQRAKEEEALRKKKSAAARVDLDVPLEGVIVNAPSSVDDGEDDLLLQIGAVKSSNKSKQQRVVDKASASSSAPKSRGGQTALGTVQSQPGSVYGREIMHSFQTDGRVYQQPDGSSHAGGVGGGGGGGGGGHDNYRTVSGSSKPNAYAPVSDVFAQRAAIKAYKKMRQHEFDLDKHSQADTRSMLSNQSEGDLPSHLRFGSENSQALDSQIDMFDEHGNYIGNVGTGESNINPMFVPKDSEYASSSDDDSNRSDSDDSNDDDHQQQQHRRRSGRRSNEASPHRVRRTSSKKNSNAATDDSAYVGGKVNTAGLAMEKSSPPSKTDVTNTSSGGGGKSVMSRIKTTISANALANLGKSKSKDEMTSSATTKNNEQSTQRSPRAAFGDFVQPNLGKISIKANGMGRKPPISPRIQDIDQVYDDALPQSV